MPARPLAEVLNDVFLSSIRNDGGTFSLAVVGRPGGEIASVTSPSFGYVVGGRGVAFVGGIGPEVLAAFVALRRSYEAPGPIQFGTWRDSATGRWWIDAVEVCDTEERARALAAETGEIAIYDLANKREIRLLEEVPA